MSGNARYNGRETWEEWRQSWQNEERYNFRTIEKKWQKIWEDEQVCKVEADLGKQKFYVLGDLPYSPDADLHVGHMRSYIALDVIARKKRMMGLNVLYPMGFAACDPLPENYALKTVVNPAVVAAEQIANFTRQLKSLGLSLDWDRCCNTCNPDYYKWTQWLFMQLFKHGLVYKNKMMINRCPTCKVDLTEAEVINGCCRHCGTETVRYDKEQWMLAVTKYAKEHGFGRAEVNFKLRDWVLSQQRRWGEPIPMVYCEHCGWQPVPENQLPLTLPEVADYNADNNADTPLAGATEWVNTACPKCGKRARRETDVMPNWVGASWYFLRACDPHNDKEFASRESLQYWLNIDWYNSATEPLALRSLYSRFWHKFLYDYGYVAMPEPYRKYTSHGMILAADGKKMAQSHEPVNTDDMVKNYGADTLRLYEMFIGPFDQAAIWSEESLNGIYRFVCRVYSLFSKVYADSNAPMSDADLRKMHRCILDVSARIEQMKFNTAISALMTYVNYLGGMEKIPATMYETLLKLLSPFAPHLAEEMWARLGHNTLIVTAMWPQGTAELAENNVVTLGVQTNGKIRGTITIGKDAANDVAETEALKLKNVARQLEGKTIKKIIVVPNKIVNIVVGM